MTLEMALGKGGHSGGGNKIQYAIPDILFSMTFTDQDVG